MTRLKQPGYGERPEQSAPFTVEELVEWFALLVSREPAVSDSVFRRQVTVPLATPPARLIIPVTDSPEITHFHLTLQQHPLDGAGTCLRAIVNRAGSQSRAQILADVLANGGAFIPGTVAQFPIMRKRRQPITVDLVAEAQPGEAGRMIVEVFAMQRVQFAPQSARDQANKLDAVAGSRA